MPRRGQRFGIHLANPRLERLEDRILPSLGDAIASAVTLSFADTSTSHQTAHVTEILARPGAVMLHRISLAAEDVVSASINTFPYGGGLDSYLRIFQDLGAGQVRPLFANDNYQARDAGLTFQAPASGDYYVGVSGFDNTAYDPQTAGSGQGSSSGLFDLNLTKTRAATALGLVGASFKISQATAVATDRLTIDYVIENRGSQASAPAGVFLLVSANNRFDDDLPPIALASIPGIDAGGFVVRSLDVVLDQSSTPLAPFTDPRKIFLGLQIDSAKPASPAQGNDWTGLQVLAAESAADAGNDSLATALPVRVNSRTDLVTIPGRAQRFFQITLYESGNLHALLSAAPGPWSLALLDGQGRLLVQSNGQSGAAPTPLLTTGLTGSPDGVPYYLKIANLDNAAGAVELTTLFAPAVSILQTVPLEGGGVALVEGDVNGDGHLDLAVVVAGTRQVTLLLGNGDGTYQQGDAVDVGLFVRTLAKGDFNGDGRLDLVASVPDGVVRLLGHGDGTFAGGLLPGVAGGSNLAVADFNGDGKLDLAIVDPGAAPPSTITIHVGRGDGSFDSLPPMPVADGAFTLVPGDFNEDGLVDLASSSLAHNIVTLFLGEGNATFRAGASHSVGRNPVTLVAGDFNGDGHLDLATGNNASDDVTVLLGDGHGSFGGTSTTAVQNLPVALVTGDFNRDGRLDLATANLRSNSVSVLLGHGDGLAFDVHSTTVGEFPQALVAGDFNEDGASDLAAANYNPHQVTVLLGHGDGVFPAFRAAGNTTGEQPDATVAHDFNGDGKLDVAVANFVSNDVSLLLGQGDGTFVKGGTFAAGTMPKALVAGDFNGDRRLDLAVAAYGYNYGPSPGPSGVSVLLGNGDGSFQPGEFHGLAGKPNALAAGDFDGDGLLDLSAALGFGADYYPGSSVVVLLGDGRGRFEDDREFATGLKPTALAVGDFDGDGNLDVAAAAGGYYATDLTVLLGNGLGDFPNTTGTVLDGGPFALTAADFDGDGRLDLAATLRGSLALLANQGGGQFALAEALPLDRHARGLVASDFSGDGLVDLAISSEVYTPYYNPADSVTLFLGNGAGNFQPLEPSFPVGTAPNALAHGDFNGDGRQDLVTANMGSANVSVLLTSSGGLQSSLAPPNPIKSTPLLLRLPGDVSTSALVLTESGQIRFRRGLAEQPGAYAPPTLVNPAPLPAARDLALVATIHGETLLAALDAVTTVDDSQSGRLARVRLYRPSAAAQFGLVQSIDLPAGFLPGTIAAGDLNGDGLGDLVISTAAADQVFVSLQTAVGAFGTASAYTVGTNPSAIELKDVDDDGRADIVAADQFSGQVSVLHNRGDGTFDPEGRFRAGTGLYRVAEVNGAQAVQALEVTSDVVVGPFLEGGGRALLALNSGTKSVALLRGADQGGFLNPAPADALFLAGSPTALVADRFVEGDDNLALAILSKEQATIAIFRADGRGGFTHLTTAAAGNQPTGLAAADVSRPGGGGPDNILDLLVGNIFGDLLILTGNGDGTFSQYRRADQGVSLAVTGSAGTGENVFFFSNTGNDTLAYKSAAPGTPAITGPTVFQDRGAGIMAPGAQAIVTVLQTRYLVVVNSGGNEVLLYTLDKDGRPDLASKQSYFTGTNPSSLTITERDNDLNGDDVPDVVIANEGSNDVSVFLGRLTDNGWALSTRPRQNSGGLGPTSVAIARAAEGDAAVNPDLLVSNGQSNNVSVLSSRGNGFFVTQGPEAALPTGIGPRQVLVGNFTGTAGLDVVTINAGSNDLTLIANFFTGAVTSTIALGGTLPVAALAIDLFGQATTDLLVANAGTGAVEHWQGTADGFEVVETFRAAGLHLSDLALVTAGDHLEVYGSDSGREIAVLLATFGPPVAPADFLPAGPGFPAGLEISEGTTVIPVPETRARAVILALATLTQADGIDVPALFSTDAPGVDVIRPAAVADRETPEAGPRADTEASPRAGDKPTGILLLNLTDPFVEDDPKDDDEPAPAAAADQRPEANPGSSPNAGTSALDLFWQEVGADARLTAGHDANTEWPCALTTGWDCPEEFNWVSSLTLVAALTVYGKPRKRRSSSRNPGLPARSFGPGCRELLPDGCG